VGGSERACLFPFRDANGKCLKCMWVTQDDVPLRSSHAVPEGTSNTTLGTTARQVDMEDVPPSLSSAPVVVEPPRGKVGLTSSEFQHL
jgi:hypothetical protein